MNIYDYAMQLERDGEQFYRDAARKSAVEGLSTILTMLADAEGVHYRIFERMKQYEVASVADSPLLQDAKNVFARIKEEGGWEGMSVSEIGTYQRAQEIEKETETFYIAQADALKGQPQEQIFRKIAAEEHRHYFLLQNMIDFVSKPETWLENAEWYHLEEY